MPLIRCPKCGQAYDVPGAVAVHLPNSIATCHCGEWIAGSKAAVLARLMNPDDIKEIDLQPYRVSAEAAAVPAAAPIPSAPAGAPRSLRVTARAGVASLNKVFTVGKHPLWIGRKGSHIVFDQPDLDLRHCCITLRGDQLVLRDADSHMGTYLDGLRITEVVVEDGVHLLRAGATLLSLEPTAEPGEPVEPMRSDEFPMIDEIELEQKLHELEQQQEQQEPKRSVLVCIDGPLNGQEFEIPPTGLVVGREGHVRVPDDYLSRKHFEVMPDSDGSIRVRDLGSRNGTFLNTLPANNTKVHIGDEIRAGVNRFRIEQRA